MTSLSEAQRAVVDAVPDGLFIGGRWRPAEGGALLDVHDPATGDVLRQVADASAADAVAALDAAHAARADWAATPPRERGDVLHRAYELMVQRTDDLALVMTLEMGKSLSESRAEIAYAAEFLRWFAEEAVRISGRFATAPAGNGSLLVSKEPVGPCLLITPWNFPAAMGTRKIGPALAAGCTVVVKPAQLTPLTMLSVVDVLREAGAPAGVVNVVTSSSASRVTEPLMADPRLRKVSFTGSTEVGRTLVKASAEHLLRTSMELGGNAPLLVFDDADLDEAVQGAMDAKMRNIGESCVASNRLFVQAGIAEQFLDRLTERMAALEVGPGVDDADVGPLVDADQLATVVRLVDDAVSKGATVRTGGHALDRPGFFFAPTVLTDIPADADLRHEEVFGPVAPVMVFETEDEAVAAANDTEFGLVAYLFSHDLDRVFRVVKALEVGMVGVNKGLVSNPAAPFGGVKASGFGREGGLEGIDEYLETKYVALTV